MSRNRYEATVKSQAACIADLNESNNIAQLLIANYKASEDEEADVERRLSKDSSASAASTTARWKTCHRGTRTYDYY